MITKNEIIRLIIACFIAALITSFIGSIQNKANATKTDLIVLENKSYDYTDKSMVQHEKVQDAQFGKLTTTLEAQMEYSRENKKMLEKLLDIQLKR